MNTRKLRHSTREESVPEGQLASGQNQVAREFNSADELLRHDAELTLVPPAIAARLQESIAREPASRRNFWRRLFGS